MGEDSPASYSGTVSEAILLGLVYLVALSATFLCCCIIIADFIELLDAAGSKLKSRAPTFYACQFLYVI
jgi:hypothetical protein